MVGILLKIKGIDSNEKRLKESKKKRRRVSKVFVPILLVLAILVAFVGVFLGESLISIDNGKNYYSRLFLDDEMKKSLKSIERVDEDGYFYSMECTEDYYKKGIQTIVHALKLISKGSCTAFSTFSEDGKNALTARNYDVPHLTKNNELSGLNVAVRCTPKGRYSSIGVADAFWLSELGLSFYKGALDDGKTNLTPLVLLPYLCMDGMNEKGLTVSILALDVKEGEHATYQKVKGRQQVIIPVLLRELLDNCATVEEAVELAKTYNVVNLLGNDYHLFVTDKTGNAAVFEWRYDELKVTYQDAIANFYVGYEDACDSYKDGVLKEKYPGPADTTKAYKYGYGHGYARFNSVAEVIENHLHGKGDKLITKMTELEAMNALKNASQKYVEGEPTSYTQYSIIYDSTNLTAKVCMNQDYSITYSMQLNGDSIIVK